MSTILTKYVGPTNHQGSRIRVKDWRGSIQVPWDSALDVSQNHRRAAKKLMEKRGLSWKSFCQGILPDDSGYAFVRNDHQDRVRSRFRRMKATRAKRSR